MEETVKKKRVMTRIGDIFCIEMEDVKVYFQYIAIDTSELSASTIRVFKKKYPLDYIFDADEVVSGEIDFYAHTMLRPGLKMNVWTKVGKSKDLGDIESVLFRTTGDIVTRCKRSFSWWVGGINKKYVMVGGLTDELRQKSYVGTVVPPIDIIEKIKTGKFRFFMPD